MVIIIIIVVIIIYFYHLSVPSISHIKLWLNYGEVYLIKYYAWGIILLCTCMYVFVWLWYTDTKAFSYWPIYLILAHYIRNIIFIFISSTEICSDMTVFLTVNFSTIYINNETDVFVHLFETTAIKLLKISE